MINQIDFFLYAKSLTNIISVALLLIKIVDIKAEHETKCCSLTHIFHFQHQWPCRSCKFTLAFNVVEMSNHWFTIS